MTAKLWKEVRDVYGNVLMRVYEDKHGLHFYDHNGSKVYLPKR